MGMWCAGGGIIGDRRCEEKWLLRAGVRGRHEHVRHQGG